MLLLALVVGFFSEYQLTSQGRKPLPPILDRHDLDKEKIY